MKRGFSGATSKINHTHSRLQARKKAMQNKQASMRDYLKVNMQRTGIKQIKCPLFTITLAAGRDMVVIDDPDHLPVELIEVKVETHPNKTEILRKLKAGDDVPGAHIEKTAESIRIK